MLCLFSPHFATEEVLKLLGPKINVEKDPSVAELLSPALCFASTLCSLPWEVCKARISFGCFFFSSLGPFPGELEPPLTLFLIPKYCILLLKTC